MHRGAVCDGSTENIFISEDNCAYGVKILRTEKSLRDDWPPARTARPDRRLPAGPAGRAADRLRAEPRPGRAARGNPERRVPDRQLRDDLIALADPVQDPRAERRLVNGDGRGGAVNPQLRLDARGFSLLACRNKRGPEASAGW